MSKTASGTYERVCKTVCEIVPQERRVAKVFPKLKYAGIKENFDVWIGKRMILVFFAGVIGFLLPLALGRYFAFLDFSAFVMPLFEAIGLGIAFALAAVLAVYLHLYYTIEGRASMVEAILPDFLMLVASNISAGMTPFSAFREGARKEFGPLSEEIKIASAKSLGTKSFGLALKQLTVKINSKILRETVSFFAQSLKSGGKLSKLLETSALDLRRTQEMKKDLASSTRMYIMFVAFVIVIATPLLLGVSIQFLEMISTVQGEQLSQGSQGISSVTFLSSELNVKPAFMLNLSYILLTGNAILASLFIGVIGGGKAKMGLRYTPAILISSIIVFVFLEQILNSMFGI